jgi:hypothetical protein
LGFREINGVPGMLNREENLTGFWVCLTAKGAKVRREEHKDKDINGDRGMFNHYEKFTWFWVCLTAKGAKVRREELKDSYINLASGKS